MDGSVDYAFSLSLPPAAEATLRGAPVFASLQPVLQGLDASLVDPATGRIILDFTATGTMRQPEVRLQTDRMRSRVRSYAEALAADAQDRAQAQLDTVEARVRAEANALEEEGRRRAGVEAQALLTGRVDTTGTAPLDSLARAAADSLVSTAADSLKEAAETELKDRLQGLFGKKKKNNRP